MIFFSKCTELLFFLPAYPLPPATGLHGSAGLGTTVQKPHERDDRRHVLIVVVILWPPTILESAQLLVKSKSAELNEHFTMPMMH